MQSARIDKRQASLVRIVLGIVIAGWGASANALLIDYDITFYAEDFSQIGEFDGGFVYDDTNDFVSNFFVDVGSYGSFHLPAAVPASALHLGSPPGLAFDSNIVVDLGTGGLSTSCTTTCVSLFNTTNVFGVFENNGVFDTIYRSGFYQILPSPPLSVPEPSTLALSLAGALLLLRRRAPQAFLRRPTYE